MDLETFLLNDRDDIVEEAERTLVHAASRRYGAVAPEELQRRLTVLYDCLFEAVGERDAQPVLRYASQLADERFDAGYSLLDVQTAFNALEEATWRHAVARLELPDLAEALGLVTTILGQGKDALACRYVARSAEHHLPTVDLRSLMTGAAGV